MHIATVAGSLFHLSSPQVLRHYLTFAHEADALDRQLRLWQLAACWSQRKNALLLHFVRQRESRIVELSLDPQFGCALVDDRITRPRRNTIDFFGELLGAVLGGVRIHDSERMIAFDFADGRSLAAFYFGRGSGNVLLVDQGRVLGAFQKHYDEYLPLLAATDGTAHLGRETIIASLRSSDLPPVKALNAALPQLGKRLALEALHRAGLIGEASLATLEAASLGRLLGTIDALYAESQSSRIYYVYHLADEVVFALTELRGLAAEALRTETFTDIATAIRACRGASVRVKRFASLRGQMARRLATEQSRLERGIAGKLPESELLARADQYERAGELLKAHLHEIPPDVASLRLSDWNGAELTVAIDPKLTPAQNVERYYRRARNSREAAASAQSELTGIRRRLDLITELSRHTATARSTEKLEDIMEK